jgi:hypothetical protein
MTAYSFLISLSAHTKSFFLFYFTRDFFPDLKKIVAEEHTHDNRGWLQCYSAGREYIEGGRDLISLSRRRARYSRPSSPRGRCNETWRQGYDRLHSALLCRSFVRSFVVWQNQIKILLLLLLLLSLFFFFGSRAALAFFFYYLSFTAHFCIISPPEEFLVHAPQNFFSLPNQRSGYTLQN